MHRSGTSCLAGSLELCGLHLGRVRRTGRHNAKGYFERPDVVQINDRILGLSGGAWHDPPTEVHLHPQLHRDIGEVVANIGADGMCAIKDPRLLLVLDAWMTATTLPKQFVGTFRHPMAVAASLHARDGLPMEQGLDLWLKYNARLVEFHREAAFPLVSYDLSDARAYRRAVLSVASALGLRPAPLRLWRFIAKRLDHNDDRSLADLSADHTAIYAYLREHSLNPADELSR